ncbi:MAG: Sir2 silent information regulator family NAD-dependent deacetylase [Bacteroidales bacterium]|nr:Sir2 silent information regulator family NAD-dependent deacetylase [Bacteroidales bacterium]
MTSTDSYSARIESLRQAIAEADHIVIGAGAGLSTAAGLDYAGEDFRREFAPWIERYGITDLYTAGFYPFESQEEYWAFWAKHIWFCRYRTGALPLYSKLASMFPDAFVVTTNVDAQFLLAGFPAANIFATQGDYGCFQPASGSPKKLVSNREWVEKVLPRINDCRIPTDMLPTMPDGSPVAMNLRVDDTFVEDFRWQQQARRYTDFVGSASQERLLLLEFGIGYNTPGIIRLPFEQFAQKFPHTTLVRFNPNHPDPYLQDLPSFVAFTEDINQILNDISKS